MTVSSENWLFKRETEKKNILFSVPSNYIQKMPSKYSGKEETSTHRHGSFFVGKLQLRDEIFDQNAYL